MKVVFIFCYQKCMINILFNAWNWYFQSKFHGEELNIYVHHLMIMQKSFNELLVTSNKRLADLETLLDFIQSATTELIWLNEKEEIEIARDWSSKSLNVTEIERYYEVNYSRKHRNAIIIFKWSCLVEICVVTEPQAHSFSYNFNENGYVSSSYFTLIMSS